MKKQFGETLIGILVILALLTAIGSLLTARGGPLAQGEQTEQSAGG